MTVWYNFSSSRNTSIFDDATGSVIGYDVYNFNSYGNNALFDNTNKFARIRYDSDS